MMYTVNHWTSRGPWAQISVCSQNLSNKNYSQNSKVRLGLNSIFHPSIDFIQHAQAKCGLYLEGFPVKHVDTNGQLSVLTGRNLQKTWKFHTKTKTICMERYCWGLLTKQSQLGAHLCACSGVFDCIIWSSSACWAQPVWNVDVSIPFHCRYWLKRWAWQLIPNLGKSSWQNHLNSMFTCLYQSFWTWQLLVPRWWMNCQGQLLSPHRPTVPEGLRSWQV